jgi:hypothetical protein
MIDTDKYKGHEYERMHIERWHPPDTPEEVMIANALLMDDAPLLLAEVKELQAWKKLVSDIVQQQDGSHLREVLKEMIK